MKPLIIVCGLGSTGYKIFSLLKQQGAVVVGINDRPLNTKDDDIVIGELRAAATLIKAGIQEAHTLVLASDDEAINLAVLTQARVLNSKIRVINRLFNTSLGDRLDRTLPDHVTMSVAALSAPVFAFAAQGNKAIGQLRLFNQTWPIYEEYIHEHHPWKNRPLSELWDDKSRMLIYYLPEKGWMDLISAVVLGQRLQVGDRLIIGTQPNIRTIRKSWLKKLPKFLHSLRQFQEYIQPMVAATIVLFTTIFIATLTYFCINIKTSIVDALYFSVGMVTGVGGNEKVVEQAPETIKVFTVFMMLIGAGVVGICYALLNDLVLGSRFKQFLDAARVPAKNHYIICGLGNIGVQIVSQLHCYGHEVVVIESDPNNRFLNIVRSLGVPVIHGDASLSANLKTANIHTSEALIAVSSNDLINLEIALSAKGITARLPVVVRIQNPEFAYTVQQVFEFEAVLSPTELAAPSFAAAALGGRILGNGMTRDILWVAVASAIASGHPFSGKRVKDAAMESDFVPLYIERNCQTIHGWDLLETYLIPGDILYLTMPAKKLEQLWRIPPYQLVAS